MASKGKKQGHHFDLKAVKQKSHIQLFLQLYKLDTISDYILFKNGG